jgi:dolichol kinase
MASLSSLLFIVFFDSNIYVLVLGFVSFLILWMGKYLKLFRSIHGIQRKSGGSYLLPISIVITFIVSRQLSNPALFSIPILILAISDPLAAVFGVEFAHRSKNISLLSVQLHKTRIGTGVFFISAFLISYMGLHFYKFPIMDAFALSLLMALSTSLAELVSPKGTDNLTIPLMSLLNIWLFW